MYDSLPDACDEVCCPQGDLAGCILRLAGHDFMDYDPNSITFYQLMTYFEIFVCKHSALYLTANIICAIEQIREVVMVA